MNVFEKTADKTALGKALMNTSCHVLELKTFKDRKTSTKTFECKFFCTKVALPTYSFWDSLLENNPSRPNPCLIKKKKKEFLFF